MRGRITITLPLYPEVIDKYASYSQLRDVEFKDYGMDYWLWNMFQLSNSFPCQCFLIHSRFFIDDMRT